MVYVSVKHPELNEFFAGPWTKPRQHDYQFSLDPDTLNLLKTCVKCGKRPVHMFTFDNTECPL